MILIKGWKKSKLFKDGFAYSTLNDATHLMLIQSYFNYEKDKLKGSYKTVVWKQNPYRRIVRKISPNYKMAHSFAKRWMKSHPRG